MADNIRPALYGARYEAQRIANRGWLDDKGRATQYDTVAQTVAETVTIAGKFCESGDVLIRDIELPRLESGHLLAIPMAARTRWLWRATTTCPVAPRSCW